LWFEIEQAFARSTTSEIWPNEYVTMSSNGLAIGTVVRATYKFLLSRRTYHYKITEYERGRKLTYVALTDHVFEGGSSIEVNPSGDGSALSWTGEYVFHPEKMVAAALFRFYWRDRFFRELDSRIRAIESEARLGSMVIT
jgi:hypothetical protein